MTYDAGDPTAFRIILGGQTSSPTSFPTQNALQSFQGVQDGFVASLKVPLQGQSFPTSLYFSSPWRRCRCFEWHRGTNRSWESEWTRITRSMRLAGRFSATNFFVKFDSPGASQRIPRPAARVAGTRRRCPMQWCSRSCKRRGLRCSPSRSRLRAQPSPCLVRSNLTRKGSIAMERSRT